MKKRILTKRRSEKRGMAELHSKTYKIIKKAPTCPYCGATMVLRKASEIGMDYGSEDYNNMYVCRDYPACDCYCRTKKKDGGIVLISTPANKKLRALRSMAHYYFDRLYKYGIFLNSDYAYGYITSKLTTGNDKQHIGDMNEHACIIVINESIKLLAQNKGRFEPFKCWYEKDVISKECNKLLQEITY